MESENNSQNTASHLKDFIFYLASGIGMCFTLIVYIHSTFSTKSETLKIREDRIISNQYLIDRLSSIDGKLENINQYLLNLKKDEK